MGDSNYPTGWAACLPLDDSAKDVPSFVVCSLVGDAAASLWMACTWSFAGLVQQTHARITIA